MDEIRINGLKIFAHHGVFEEEKENGQDFIINAVLYTDIERAGLTDDLNETVDYGAVCQTIREVMTKNTYDLIETAAQECAYAILRGYERVHSVDIEIKKPHAPVKMVFESMAVKINRAWHTAVLSLGSNMGDKNAYIESAVAQLRECDMIKDVLMSTLIETEPYGYTEQDKFINGAVVLKTLYSPEALLEFAHTLENIADRRRKVHWGPRTLDIDIVFFDELILGEPELVIPHPDMQNRFFVLEPLAEIVPNYMHPVYGKTVTQLLEELNEKHKEQNE